MDIPQYYAQVKVLGLRKTHAPNVYFCPVDGEMYNVTDPGSFNCEQRRELIDKLKEAMGITWRA